MVSIRETLFPYQCIPITVLPVIPMLLNGFVQRFISSSLGIQFVSQSLRAVHLSTRSYLPHHIFELLDRRSLEVLEFLL